MPNNLLRDAVAATLYDPDLDVAAPNRITLRNTGEWVEFPTESTFGDTEVIGGVHCGHLALREALLTATRQMPDGTVYDEANRPMVLNLDVVSTNIRVAIRDRRDDPEDPEAWVDIIDPASNLSSRAKLVAGVVWGPDGAKQLEELLVARNWGQPVSRSAGNRVRRQPGNTERRLVVWHLGPPRGQITHQLRLSAVDVGRFPPNVPVERSNTNSLEPFSDFVTEVVKSQALAKEQKALRDKYPVDTDQNSPYGRHNGWMVSFAHCLTGRGLVNSTNTGPGGETLTMMAPKRANVNFIELDDEAKTHIDLHTFAAPPDAAAETVAAGSAATV